MLFSSIVLWYYCVMLKQQTRLHAGSKAPTSPQTQNNPFRVTRIAAPLRQSVMASLRAAIAVGRLKPGERLTERDVCEMTGVSRTLVREAFRQMESEGLITVLPHRGPVVTRVSPQQAEGIYQVRRVLEGLASELFAAHASGADLAALKEALKTIKAALQSAEPTVRVNAKNDFYDCLLRGAGNEALAQSLSMLNARIMLLRSTSLQVKGRAKESVKELSVLVDALSARDARAAREAAMRHVQNAADAALAILRKESADVSG